MAMRVKTLEEFKAAGEELYDNRPEFWNDEGKMDWLYGVPILEHPSVDLEKTDRFWIEKYPRNDMAVVVGDKMSADAAWVLRIPEDIVHEEDMEF